MNEEAITTAQAASELGVHVVTLRKWRAKSSYVPSENGVVMEDCQGLTFYYETSRRVMYYMSSVKNLKRILNKRKHK